MIKQALRRLIPIKFQKTLMNYKILSIDFGQWKSIKKNMCMDAQNNPIPWYTYPAIEYLKQFDMRDNSIFEFGSGNSSHFWANRAKDIISVEDDKKWFDSVNKSKMNNQQIVLVTEREEYTSCVSKFSKKFDVIIVDGKYRLDCARNAVKCLQDNGVIILDNSDWFPKTSEYLRSQDLIEVDFSGFGPINNYTWTTSLYLSRDFSFKTLNPIQPIKSIGSLEQYAEEDN